MSWQLFGYRTLASCVAICGTISLRFGVMTICLKLGPAGGTLWMKYIIFEVLAGYCPFARVFLSLVVGCLWGYEGPNVGVVLLGQKLTYGLCLIGVKQQ